MQTNETQEKTREQAMEKSILMITLVVVMVLAVTACNTVEGVGRDLSSAARGVKETLPQGE